MKLAILTALGIASLSGCAGLTSGVSQEQQVCIATHAAMIATDPDSYHGWTLQQKGLWVASECGIDVSAVITGAITEAEASVVTAP